jgi:hypothetical protein
MSLNKEIKPSVIPNNVMRQKEHQEIHFNLKGFYGDLGLRIKA